MHEVPRPDRARELISRLLKLVGEPDDAAARLIDAGTSRALATFAFDIETFEALRQRLLAGTLGPAQSRLRARVEPPRTDDVEELPRVGSPARARLHARGLAAIRAGEVGAVILAGGMATRFGGVVKATVEVVDKRSFLELKLAELAALGRRHHTRIPAYVMTSSATHDRIGEQLRELAASSPELSAWVEVEVFPQAISMRVTPGGAVVLDDEGRLSLCAPGHGDMSFALRRAGALGRFIGAGGRVLMMSNVDNLAATLDPAIVGAHLLSGRDLTVEVVDKNPGDRGGAPARVEGALRLVEAFAFPESFDQDAIPQFNTNTLTFNAGSLDREFALTWYAVRKRVGGREVIQFERLVGELSAFLRSHYLRVERVGPDARFMPVKDPAELARRAPAIRALVAARIDGAGASEA